MTSSNPLNEPSGSMNISQILFKLDEKTSDKSMQDAYINQSRLSTYYQDNPYGVLDFTQQFGLRVPGGPINNKLGSGSRPVNTFPNYQQTIKSGQVNTSGPKPVNTDGPNGPNFYSFISR